MITKSGYIYTISGKMNGKDFNHEVKSFSSLPASSIMAQLIEGQTAISLSDIKTSTKEVVFGITEDAFLKNAKVLKTKGTKEEK